MKPVALQADPVAAVCAANWNPPASRCRDCPIARTCHAWYPCTEDGLARRRADMTAAALAAQSGESRMRGR